MVGLEIWTSAQAAIDTFLAGPGGPAARAALLEQDFWRRDFQDGRSSAAMADLLEDCRRHRGSTSWCARSTRAFDSPSDRDARMAAAVMEAVTTRRPAQTLVLVGDVHSRVLPGYPWDPAAAYLSVGAHLRKEHADTVGLRTPSGGGSAWMCLSNDAKDCGVRKVGIREIAGELPRIVLDPVALEATGWSGTLFLPALTASPPALSAN